jgi:tRNA modification GTPase
LRAIRGAAGDVLDRALILWLPGPASYTGENSAELHLHGGAAVLRAVLERLTALGARQAEPGEFTRRAFLNGRMDLLEAEGIADLVTAETDAQRRQALLQVSGTQSGILAGWADRLRRMLAWQEALIDFPDEDLPPETDAELQSDIRALAVEMDAAIADGERGIKLRDGLVVAVIGAPNAGKSSLVNALARRDIAIVSPIPGTTRDTLEAAIELGGVPITLVDTAGLRATQDAIEAEGVRRAQARAASADVVLRVIDASQPDAADDLLIVPAQARHIMVFNKIDLTPAPIDALGISVASGDGLAQLLAVLQEAASALAMPTGSAVLTRMRHVVALREAASALREAQRADLPELRGEDLRRAMRALGTMTGAVDVEGILDTVFGAFCIGK